VPAPALSKGKDYEPHVAAEESVVLEPGAFNRGAFDQSGLGANRSFVPTLYFDFTVIGRIDW
jgi:hypothetical protein